MTGTVPLALAVTTSDTRDGGIAAYAQTRAAVWGLPFMPRRGRALALLLAEHARALLVFGHDGVTLRDGGGALRFHLGMAELRRKRLDRGEQDTLVQVARLIPGERVLDATLGLAQDALVAARAVGPLGMVVGVEKSLALHAVVAEGLNRLIADERSCPVRAVHDDAAAYLATLAAGSFDVVLLDPMFVRPAKAQPGFAMLRRYAEHAPLGPAQLAAARRVARRLVVIKACRYGNTLAEFGLRGEAGSRYGSVVWSCVPGNAGAK